MGVFKEISIKNVIERELYGRRGAGVAEVRVDSHADDFLEALRIGLDRAGWLVEEDAVDAETDVMDPFAAFLDELRDRRVGAGRLEQLEIRVTDGEERGLHALRLDDFDVIDRQAEGFVDLRRVERFDGDADVIEYRFVHTPRTSAPQMCLCSCV